ncbi:MAG: hypothetical protein PVJ39_07300 [Gammaproteobacteria bacterium]|jgi:hypothetical protein
MEHLPVPPTDKLRVEIVLTLIVKFLFLLLLWLLFFHQPGDSPPPKTAIENNLFGPANSAEPIKPSITKEPSTW